MTVPGASHISRHREKTIACADCLRDFIKSNSDWIFRSKSSTATAADRTIYLSFAKSVLLSSAVNSITSILAVSVGNIRAKRFRIIKQSM